MWLMAILVMSLSPCLYCAVTTAVTVKPHAVAAVVDSTAFLDASPFCLLVPIPRAWRNAPHSAADYSYQADVVVVHVAPLLH